MKPPFQITPAVLSVLSKLERLIGRAEVVGAVDPSPQLRRENQIRTVHASCAIEGNTLSLEQVTDVLDGKRVAGSAREISEVKNALAAYALAHKLKPQSEKDLLKAHGVLMRDLAPDAGKYRRGGVGVVAGSRVVHVAPQAKRVPELMANLFAYMGRDTETHPLVRACVFHYELEFIHPFSDGNGRAGRLWQHVIASAYSPVFLHVPTESVIKDNQAAYYAVLARSDKAAESTEFVEFRLHKLLEALQQLVKESQKAPRQDAEARLEVARAHFAAKTFSRADYRALHLGISAPTASRDWRAGVERGLLRAAGDKATRTYVFKR
jgi:Fic family protein